MAGKEAVVTSVDHGQAEVHYKGEKRGVFGFQEGKEILRLISERSAVKPVRTDR